MKETDCHVVSVCGVYGRANHQPSAKPFGGFS